MLTFIQHLNIVRDQVKINYLIIFSLMIFCKSLIFSIQNAKVSKHIV